MVFFRLLVAPNRLFGAHLISEIKKTVNFILSCWHIFKMIGIYKGGVDRKEEFIVDIHTAPPRKEKLKKKRCISATTNKNLPQSINGRCSPQNKWYKKVLFLVVIFNFQHVSCTRYKTSWSFLQFNYSHSKWFSHLLGARRVSIFCSVVKYFGD